MEKFPRAKHTLETKKRGEDVIGWLGLSFDDLKGKVTLDVGAGSGEVSAEGEKNGCTIIAIDAKPELWEEEGIQENIPYAVANARLLPFADNTFDYVLSHAAPPTTWTETPELVAKTLEEYIRVLKPDGEVRFGSGMGTLDDNAINKLMAWWEKVLAATPVVGEKIDQGIRERHSLAFLESLHPQIVREEPKDIRKATQVRILLFANLINIVRGCKSSRPRPRPPANSVR
ncbi:MAG TPA: class I SAM-dependent methyltransferase [Candidatus Paceibacterota bacterium]|nr:class I SAM-dependent methyltransferase [Candidatus Paceibacterota bacterium]